MLFSRHLSQNLLFYSISAQRRFGLNIKFKNNEHVINQTNVGLISCALLLLLLFTNSLIFSNEAVSASTLAGMLNGVEPLDGSNYTSWKEKIEILLALSNIDYCLQHDEPKEPDANAEGYADHKKAYDEMHPKWKESNRKCLMVLKASVHESIRGAIPTAETAKEYLSKVEEQFQGSTKAYATSLIRKLSNDKYDGSGIREHIMKMSNIAAKLEKMEMKISDGFLVHFVMTSLPPQFSHFSINYNNQEKKWSINELMATCVQEEERLKAEGPDYANSYTHHKRKGSWDQDKAKGKQSKFSHQDSPKKQESAGGSNSQVDPSLCKLCRSNQHMQIDCIGFLKWLNKKGYKYEEDPKKRHRKEN